jgi:hypothetical protein
VRIACCLIVSLMVLGGCAGEAPTAGEAAAEVDPAVELLPHPFTPEQIRDEWIVGFRLTLRRGIDGTRSLERWTVVAADERDVEIEFAQLDPAGAVIGEPNVQRISWTDLRDHASFPAHKAERESATRETSLGTLDGWLYTVREDDQGTTSEYFFAQELPGAPVQMQTIRGNTVVAELEQLERFRPVS